MAFTAGTRIGPRPNIVKASNPPRRGLQYHIPVIGDIHDKSPLAYRATRGAVEVANAAQMARAKPPPARGRSTREAGRVGVIGR